MRPEGQRFVVGNEDQAVRAIQVRGKVASQVAFQLMATWPGEVVEKFQIIHRDQLHQPPHDQFCLPWPAIPSQRLLVIELSLDLLILEGNVRAAGSLSNIIYLEG